MWKPSVHLLEHLGVLTRLRKSSKSVMFVMYHKVELVRYLVHGLVVDHVKAEVIVVSHARVVILYG